ncbi:LacI family DNA-binding transcriptional regulator [Flavivirga aquimarina]|uniref:LacI family DNA-binding transcriptional regulator n=1 Tax=Flavivirga aquimarina TaxID=2027862 RepID=A0ABT8W717_9FLAO|nr:LacI family DNA-binding transcriptional regulator [Flavivirga aquimarina]MDO5968895.1 LacI family DNA-binding transcriptional regulator [Flavivirga aquimarina]
MKTIKDIAKLANISAGTVDRVLHNRGGVSEKTKKLVNQIIKDSGFEPNLIGRNLKLNKEYNLVVLIPFSNEDSPFWIFPKQGIEKAIKEVSHFGAKVDVRYFDQYDPKSFEKELVAVLSLEGVDGLIISPHFVKESIKHKNLFKKLKVPYTFINTDLDGFNNASFVGQDSFKSGYLSAKLFDISQTKESTILIITALQEIENYHILDSRIKGFRKYFEEKPSSLLKIETLEIAKFGENITKDLTKKLITNNDIKGIFVPSIKINIVAEYLDEFEIEMDTVVGYDLTIDNLKYLKSGVITFLIGQEPFNQGYNSVKLMFDHLAHNTDLKSKYISPIHVIVKENSEYHI